MSTESARKAAERVSRYKYEPGVLGGFIILRREGTGQPGAWGDHGWAEIGEWCADEEEAKETIARLEFNDEQS